MPSIGGNLRTNDLRFHLIMMMTRERVFLGKL
jgi:hypothetical protein